MAVFWTPECRHVIDGFMLYTLWYTCYTVGMHVHIVPNRTSPPTVLLRESYREGKVVKKRTLANLSQLSMAQIEQIRHVLRGEPLAAPASLFQSTPRPITGMCRRCPWRCNA